MGLDLRGLGGRQPEGILGLAARNRLGPLPAGHTEAALRRPVVVGVGVGVGVGRGAGRIDGAGDGAGTRPVATTTGEGLQGASWSGGHGRRGRRRDLRRGTPPRHRFVLPGFAPVVPILQEPVEPVFHPAAQAVQSAAAPGRLPRPLPRGCPKRLSRTAAAGSSSRDPIHQLAAPTYPAVDALVKRIAIALAHSPTLISPLHGGGPPASARG